MENTVSIKKNFVYSIARQIGRFLFPMVAFPYASRILGSEGFGKFSFSLSLINIFILIASLGNSNYAIREGSRIKNDKDKINRLVSEILMMSILSSFISLAFLCSFFVFFRQLKAYEALSFCLSLIIILNGIGADWVNYVYENFKYLAYRNLIFQIVALIVMFAFVKNQSNILIFCLVYVISSAGGNICNILYLKKHFLLRIVKPNDLLKHIKPIMILFAGSIATEIYINSDIMMVRYFTNDNIVGVYSAVSKLYSVIKQILGSAMLVMMPRISFVINKKDSRSFRELSIAFFEILVIISISISIGAYMLAEDIILLVSGAEYIGGASAFKILALTICVASLAGYFVNVILIPNRKDTIVFRATLIASIVNITINVVLIPRCGMVGAAITTFLAETIVAVLGFIKCRKLIDIIIDCRTISLICFANIGVIFICYFCKCFNGCIYRVFMPTFISVGWCLLVFRKKIRELAIYFD
ncbi:flippase [Butyrivibrio sp. WCD2001]|uniref:flippase n=1 Tax=Butyrivibrio sp. WCD2001 TaxID=1280681 RepID=UPI00047955A4|nr:flippase [Butyrivibrio sp. WCD2001]